MGDEFNIWSRAEIGVQGCGVACEEFSSWRDSNVVKEVLQGEGVLKKGLLFLCDWLEHLGDPFAKAVWKAADVRADWAGGPSSVFHSFVDFIHDVELAKEGFGC